MPPLPQFLLTEFSNPVFEKDSETPGESPPEAEDRRSAKPSANGFGIHGGERPEWGGGGAVAHPGSKRETGRGHPGSSKGITP